MKIGFDAHVLDGRYQGSRTVITRIAQILAEDNKEWSVCLYCASNLGDIGISEKYISHSYMPMSGNISRLLYHMPKLSLRDKLDATIFQHISSPFARNPWVVIHDILPITHYKMFPLIFRLRSYVFFSIAMLISKKIITVSQYTADKISEFMPSVSNKIVVVRNGPSFDESEYFEHHDRARATRIMNSEKPYIMVVGRIEKRKNVDLLISAFLKSNVKSANLVIVGKIETTEQVNLSVPGVIHLQGVDEVALKALYANAEMFVYPSAAEGFGLPLLDAVLFGVPTLSSNQTAMPEVGGGLAEYFDPTASGAIDHLAARIFEHFNGNPVKKPSLEERRRHAAVFSWKTGAQALTNSFNRDISATKAAS
jgi:glycosyltransferase involved in cell wall biosynthesis